MKRIVLIASLVFLLGGCSLNQGTQESEGKLKETNFDRVSTYESRHQTELFINQWLKSKEGLLTTYIKESKHEDADLVAGRDVLSETLGLSMVYALNQNDEALFSENKEKLSDYFLEKDGFAYWKLTETGKKEVNTNALIDDIRIANALKLASEKWGDDGNSHMAEVMSDYIFNHNVYRGTLVDFYDRKHRQVSTDITLSYIDAEAMENVAGNTKKNKDIAAKTIQILNEAPLKNGFYPKYYQVDKKAYQYDEKVNIVDQAIIAYHQAKVGERSEAFLVFIRNEMNKNGYINGMYNLDTKENIVDYESPAVYGFLIMYLLEIDEGELANDIFHQMILLRNDDASSPYYGGYSVTKGDTHIFDNLLPLIAEQMLLEQ